ncbi:MAG TPA: ATP-binding protein [Stellaceae bacterium]|nr:ATP-binding protein [Stellaceae bacterium]
MAASLTDTLWQEFAVETEDHLLAVEPLLSRGDLEQTDASEIAQLFRSFHSIKGIARAMDVLGMEAVAHHAENLLGLVREGRAPLDAELADLLLQSVDALKQLRGRVVAEHGDAAADPALLSRLAAAFGHLEAGGSAAAAPPAEVPAPAAADSSLHEDPEMLGIFVEMLRQRGAELCGALSDAPTDREAAADAAETLAHAAEVMAFEALAAGFQGVFAIIQAAGAEPLAGAVRQDLVARLGDIRLQIELVGEITGEDAGAAEFAAALAARTGEDSSQLVTELEAALEQLRADLDGEDWVGAEADAAPVARLAGQLHAALAALPLTRLPPLLLLVEDLYSRAAASELIVSDTLLDATEALLTRIEAGSAAAIVDYTADEAAAVAGRLRGSLADPVPTAAGGGRVIAGVHIPAELLSVLSAENIAGFEEAAAAGLNPYAVLVHLESEPGIAQGLVGWLTVETRAITNRTVVTGGESWFEFLVLSPLPPAGFAAALTTLDPTRQCLKRVWRLTELPEGEPVLDTAEITAAAPAEAAPVNRRSAAAANVIRVRSETIDAFLDEIGEMRAAVGMLSHVARGKTGLAALSRSERLVRQLPPESRAEFTTLLQGLVERERLLLDAEERLSGIVSRVHQSALDFRVVPVDVVFGRLPRVVRDLARRQGKAVELAVEGRDVRIDKSMVEALADPMLHMVRNAVDHGIETPEERRAAGKPERARLTLRASQRGAEIAIEIGDDGRGLDAGAIRTKAVDRGLVTAARAANLDDAEIHQFIFAAGLSTAAAVTETSGRGVGMDVVLNTVRRLGGDITIRSEPGSGTVFTLTLPVSAALQNALIVRIADQILAIPERNVAAVTEVEPDAIRRIGAERSILYRQAALPLYDLGELLGMAGTPNGKPAAARPVIVASNGRHLVGLEVGAIEYRQELFLRDLHPLLARFPGIGGASVLGDGRVVLVLDGDEVIQLAARGIDNAAAEERRAVS